MKMNFFKGRRLQIICIKIYLKRGNELLSIIQIIESNVFILYLYYNILIFLYIKNEKFKKKIFLQFININLIFCHILYKYVISFRYMSYYL